MALHICQNDSYVPTETKIYTDLGRFYFVGYGLLCVKRDLKPCPYSRNIHNG